MKGETDGTPKTPAWAAAITGMDKAKIKELAELLAKSNTEIAGAWSPQRAQHGEMTHWAMVNFAALTGKIGLDRLRDLTAFLYEEMGLGEKIYYERCTACHGPREPSQFTQKQWRSITPSMFPRAGMNEEDAALVTEFLMKHAVNAN